MPIRFSVRYAVACHLDYDVDDLKDYRYQRTRTPCEIYSDPRGGPQNFTATKTARKPKESEDHFFGTWKWREVPAEGVAASMGWHIWESINDDE